MLAKCTLIQSLAGMLIENTFSRELPDESDLQAVADAMAVTFAGSDWLTGRSTGMQLLAVRVEDDTPGLAGTGETQVNPFLSGDDAGDMLPPLTACVVQWKGSMKGKNGRGRMFLTGFTVGTQSSGFWTGDALDPASAAASVVFDAYGPLGDGTLCIINKRRDNADLTPHESNLVRAFTVDNIVRRMGSREQLKGI